MSRFGGSHASLRRSNHNRVIVVVQNDSGYFSQILNRVGLIQSSCLIPAQLFLSRFLLHLTCPHLLQMTHPPLDSTTRPDPSYRALAEANQRRRLFNASPTMLELCFNKTPPPYRSQSGTPLGGGPSEVSQDDPALLRRLRKIARMIPLKWAENQYAGMSQKEKQEALEEWEEIRNCIEKDKEEREKRLDKFLYEGPTYGSFPDDDEAPESPPTVHTPLIRPTAGKRKREAGDPHREHSLTGSSPKPICRPTKRVRNGKC